MEKLKDIGEIRQAAEGTKPSVFVFKADWCADCRYMEPFLPEVETGFKGELDFFEIDRDEFPGLAEDWGILGIPGFVVYKGGREVVRFVSKLRKTREEIESFLNRAVQVAGALPPENRE